MTEVEIRKNIVEGLSPLFDLLAKYDYEDKKREALEAGSSPTIVASGVSTSDVSLSKSDNQNKNL